MICPLKFQVTLDIIRGVGYPVPYAITSAMVLILGYLAMVLS